MVEKCHNVFTNMTYGRIFVNMEKITVGWEGWTIYNEKGCFVQNGKIQQIKVVFVDYTSSESDGGVAWGNNRESLCN